MFLKEFFLLLWLRFFCGLSPDNFLTEKVRMRDGKYIAVDYYRSLTNEKFPVILEMTPYGKSSPGTFRNEGEFWYRNGYILAIADVRGTGDSEGEFELISNDGNDGFDLIDWIAKQPWSNGKVGMRGASYSGTNQLYIAAKNPKNLLCITPSASVGKFYDFPPFGKAFSLNWALFWLGTAVNLPHKTNEWVHSDPSEWLNHLPLYTLDEYVTGRVLPLYKKFLQHPTFDSYWDRNFFKPENYSQINIPSLAFTGWFDSTMHGTIGHYMNLKTNSKNENHFLIVGPYAHETATEGGYDLMTGEPVKKLGDLTFEDNAFLPGQNMTKEFYDWCLKDGPKPKWQSTKVYITGENKWVESPNFLSDNLKDKYLYLSSKRSASSVNGDGKLDLDQPENGKDSFLYDPDKPVMSNLIKDILSPVNINLYLNKTDFLVYTSPRIKNAFNIFGEVKLELTFSSNVKDTDFIAFLMDVDENGNSIKLGSMDSFQIRTRYRNGFDKEVLMEPNNIYNLTIDFYEIGHQFLPGHRVRLAITSSFYPVVSRNLNTGYNNAFDMGPPIKSTQTVYYGSPSNGFTSRIHFKSNNLHENTFDYN